MLASGALLQFMSDEDTKGRLDAIKEYLATTSAARKSQIINNPLFQLAHRVEPVKVPKLSSESDSDKSTTQYHDMAQNRTLKELAAPDVDH